ncbi:MAG: EamA family transporter [Chloroflexi bacterium]|nr:EamA family transporter [Chloroflexota bacterium]
MPAKYRAPAWAIWAALGSVYVIWGSTYLGIRFAIETMPPFLMGAVRLLIAGGLLYGLRRLVGDPAPTRREWRSAAIVGLCLMTGGNGAVVWAEQRVPSGLTALLVGMTPLWIVLLDWLQPFHRLARVVWPGRARPAGQRPARRAWLGLTIGLIGMAVLIGPHSIGNVGGVDLLGAAALLLGTLAWAAGSLYNRTARLPSSPLLGTAMEMLAGAGGLLVLSIAFGDWGRLNLAAVSGKSLLALTYLIIFGSWVAFSAYIWLLRVAPTPLVATYAYVNPVVAMILGSLLAGEPITSRSAIAAAIILAGVVLTTTARPAAPKLQPTGRLAAEAVTGGE